MPSTPAEWRDELVRRLDTRWAKLRVFDAYYEGDQVLAYATQRFREQYGGLFAALTDNWMKVVVDARSERLRVQGFRFGPGEDADKDAQKMWQANGMDAQANMVHTEASKLSEAYWMVQPNGDVPKITAEHPSQCIVACAPGDRRTRVAALKKWLGEDDFIYANVYLPDRIVKYRTRRILDGNVDVMPDVRRTKWETIGASSNPLGEVPIVPVTNNPSMIHGGRSDLAGGPISLQDAINKVLADMLVGSEYISYPQRVLLGVDQPRDGDGKPLPLDEVQNRASASRLWMFPGKDAKAFEFSAAQLGNFREAMDGLVRDLTAQTRTPPHYVSGQIINASGDTLKAAETGLVAVVKNKQDPFGDGHEDTIRLGFKAMDGDDERAQATDIATIWADCESRSDAERADAAVKKAAIGVPWEQLMEDLGYSPTQIDRMQAMRDADSLMGIDPNATQQNALESVTRQREANAQIDARESTQP